MCHQLYRRIWEDVGCARVGRSGQAQFGVDIIGTYRQMQIGLQCKHYNKKSFTLKTVADDIHKAEAAGLALGHLKFATTAPNDSKVVREVFELSEKRRADGRFTVSVDFWGDICCHLQMHPEVGRAFITNFPGGALVTIKETAAETLEIVREMHASSGNSHEEVISLIKTEFALSRALPVPDAKGDEADPAVVATLDFVRDRLREGRTKDARKLLSKLGEPSKFKDQFSKFRWHTNLASIELEEGNTAEAAEGYLRAFELAKDNEKALSNRAHALLLKRDYAAALEACNNGLEIFPDSHYLWSLWLHAQHALGNESPEAGVPDGVRDSPDLLFSRARLASKRGDFAGALELLRLCLDTDGGSFEAKRALLVEALSWATQESVHAGHSHLSSEQRSGLNEAIDRLEPLEQTLSSIQSESTSLEMTSNVAIALWLLGQDKRAQSIAAIFLSRHPLSEGLLRIRLSQLDEDGDIAAIHSLTDERLVQLTMPVLAILAEVSARTGNCTWHESIQACVEKVEADEKRLRDLRVLSFQAVWSSGERDKALASLNEYLGAQPDHVMARVMLSQFLVRKELKDEAVSQAVACVRQVESDGSPFELLQVADQLYRLDKHGMAGALYERLVVYPGADELTIRLLICLIETDQRRKAKSILEKMPPADRQVPAVRRIECNLARRMADWPRLRELLAVENERVPDAADIGVAFAGALYRVNDHSALRAYLESDPRFSSAKPEDEFEFAKHQAGVGLYSLAVRRLYRVYRENSDSTKVAGYYLSQLLLAPVAPELATPLQVAPGVAVLLRDESDAWWVAIDEGRVPSGSWPELVSPDSRMAQQIIGRKRGERLLLDRGVIRQEVEIAEFKSIFAFAADKAHERIQASVSPEGPLWSFKAYKEDGELNLDAIANTARGRREAIDWAFASYREHRFPICCLAGLIGTDIVTLVLDWPYTEASFFVGIGTHEERDAAISLLEAGQRRFVLDLVAIVELTRHGLFEDVVRLIGQPLIPQSARDDLVNIIQLADKQQPVATVGEQGGRLSVTEITSTFHKQRNVLLHSILANIDSCEVCPTVGPEVISEELHKASQLLDAQTIDAIYLCIERDAVLVTEDGGLRLFAPALGLKSTICLQPIFLVACGRGMLAKGKYAKVVAEKIQRNHDFVSVRAEDLLLLANQDVSKVSGDARAALETFRRPSIDFISAVKVAAEFLRAAMTTLPPGIVGDYSKLVYDVLVSDRPDSEGAVKDALAVLLQRCFGRNGRRLNSRDRRRFGGLLERRAK